MVRPGQAPLGGAILIDVFLPAVCAGAWWLLSRGLSNTLGTTDRPGVRRMTKIMFWFVLVAAYVMMFSMTFYAYVLAPK
jgi:hypothetical protein